MSSRKSLSLWSLGAPVGSCRTPVSISLKSFEASVLAETLDKLGEVSGVGGSLFTLCNVAKICGGVEKIEREIRRGSWVCVCVQETL